MNASHKKEKSLPILVILEDHYHYETVAALTLLFPHLKKMGYDTLGIEYDANKDYKKDYLETVDFFSTEFNKALTCVDLSMDRLRGMTFEQIYTPERDFKIKKFCELNPGFAPTMAKLYDMPATFDRAQLHKKMIKQGFAVIGVDRPIQSNDRRPFEDEKLLDRDELRVELLLNARKAGKQCVSSLGAAHFFTMAKILNQKYPDIKDQFIFIYPFTTRQFTDKYRKDPTFIERFPVPHFMLRDSREWSKQEANITAYDISKTTSYEKFVQHVLKRITVKLYVPENSIAKAGVAIKKISCPNEKFSEEVQSEIKSLLLK